MRRLVSCFFAARCLAGCGGAPEREQELALPDLSATCERVQQVHQLDVLCPRLPMSPPSTSSMRISTRGRAST